jgi:hypothetical protein
MSKLSQRAVDYSIKAYELRCPEFCRHVRYTEHELRDIHFCLADRCRKILVAGLPADSDSRFVWSAFRIGSTLQATCTAATEIAQNTMLFLESGQVQESLALKEMGQTVNRLVRLCCVALFKEEVQHAKSVLQNQGVGRWFELIAYHVRSDISQGSAHRLSLNSVMRTADRTGYNSTLRKGAKDGVPELLCLVESGTLATSLAAEHRWRWAGGLFVFVGLGEQIAELIESSSP